MEIAILRHGKPKLICEDRIPASAFFDWIKQYNTSPLSTLSVPPDNAQAYTKECHAVISSTLPRSIDSAKALNSDKLVLSNELFIEAELPFANWGGLKLRPTTWAVIFRMLWLFGYSKNSESYKNAKLRAATAANKLIALTEAHQKVLFVGHGIFNRLLAKELTNKGWSISKKPSSTYWGFGVYTR